jgi:hypothetical protein
MAKAIRTIKVMPNSELARLLEQAQGATLRLEKDGVHYHLTREDDEAGEVETAGTEDPPRTLEMAYGSVPALNHTLDPKDVERIAREEHIERSIRKMHDQ